MQKFGNAGTEFWWNDEVQNLGLKIGVFFCIIFFIIPLKMEKPGSLLFILSGCILVFLVVALIHISMLERKKVPALYMNEEGIVVWGDFCSWNHVKSVEIKSLYRGAAGPRDWIYIYFQLPEDEKERCFAITPEKEEIMEIKIYIEAFWEYYKTN